MMAFSFNWAGIRTPSIAVKDRTEAATRAAENFGAAARGYVNRSLDTEFADMVRGRSDAQGRIAEIEKELATLRSRNAEIRAILGA